MPTQTRPLPDATDRQRRRDAKNRFDGTPYDIRPGIYPEPGEARSLICDVLLLAVILLAIFAAVLFASAGRVVV